MTDFSALLAKRDQAAERGDLSMVREITVYLQRNGYVETAVPESQERAVPPKPRGRPRKSTV